MTKKISQLSALTTPHDADLLVVNDSTTGITKKIARSDFFGGLVPPGLLAAYIAAAAPTGWLLCDGSAVNRSTYSTLFAAIGTTYGAGDGSTTFNLPNLKGKVPVGLDSGQTEFNALNTSSGEKTHLLTTNEMPTHNHSLSDPGHNHAVYDPGHSHPLFGGNRGNFAATDQGGVTWEIKVDTRWDGIGGSGSNIGIYGNTTGISIANAGSSAAHNNLQPYLVVNYIIKT